MSEYCVCCGAEIPEGRSFCPICEKDEGEESGRQRQLNRYKKVTGASSYNTDYNPHKYVENVLHGEKLSFPAKAGQKRMTAGTFSEKYPKGKYILNMAKHWSCCVDGIIYDTWDCTEKCVYTAYRVG